MNSDALLGGYNPSGPTIQPCLSGGLWDAGAAISIGGKHIANWMIGQVRNSSQSEEKLCIYAQEIGADETAFIEAFREVPSMSLDQFSRIAQVLYTLAKQLSTMAYQNIQQARFIVERKKTEESLHTSKERYRALTELLPIGIFEIDTQGTISFANQAIFKMTGYNRQDLQSGIQLHKIIVHHDRERASAKIQHLFAGNSFDGDEYQIVRKDGSTFAAFINSQLYTFDSTQRLIGYVFDLSAMKDKEQALLESEEKLARSKKMESLGLLAGGVAHDLNNMLSGLVSYPELLLLDIPESDPLHRPLKTIQKSGEKAVHIVQDLLTMARRGVLVTRDCRPQCNRPGTA